MSLRYTDLDLDVSGARDFVVRQRTPSVLQLVLIFLSVLFLVITTTLTVGNPMILIAVLFGATGMAGWYVIVQIQRARDLLLATEFQNSLFASALGLNHKFCLIIRNNGSIVYLDRSFQSMFPDFSRLSLRSIDTLLAHGKVSAEDSEKIYQSIEHGTFEKVVFEIRGTRSEPYKIIMSIEPILRPSGFVLLRGREYIEKRTATSPSGSGDGMSKPTIALFSHVMDSMNMGVYMTNPGGMLIYVNPAIEQWLGYVDGELTARNLSLNDMVYQGGHRSHTADPADFEGEVMLQKKNGGLVKAFINQKLILGPDRKVIGCTAVAHLLPEEPSDGKKKLW